MRPHSCAQLTRSIRNRYNEKPIDLLPPNPEPESDDGKIRSAIRKAAAESAVAAKGDVVDGESCLSLRIANGADDDDVFDPNDIASDSD